MKKLTVILVIMILFCGVLFSLTGCNPSGPNTRETAKELNFGEKAVVTLGTDDYYWYFFELEAETKIALEGAQQDAVFTVFPDGQSEAIAEIRSEFWSGILNSGKYYVKVVCKNGNLFGTIAIFTTLFNLNELPYLPIDNEFSLDQQEFSGLKKEAYYRVDIDEDSNINVKSHKHPDLQVKLTFYYSCNSSMSSYIFFDYTDDFADFEQTTQISSGECIVLVQYKRIASNAKKPNILMTAKLTITITNQNNAKP